MRVSTLSLYGMEDFVDCSIKFISVLLSATYAVKHKIHGVMNAINHIISVFSKLESFLFQALILYGVSLYMVHKVLHCLSTDRSLTHCLYGPYSLTCQGFDWQCTSVLVSIGILTCHQYFWIYDGAFASPTVYCVHLMFLFIEFWFPRTIKDLDKFANRIDGYGDKLDADHPVRNQLSRIRLMCHLFL